MSPQEFDDLAWKEILGEATDQERQTLTIAKGSDEFLSGRFEQMAREYTGLKSSLDVVSSATIETDNRVIPEARLSALLDRFGPGDVMIAASSANPPVIQKEGNSSAKGWAVGAIAAGAIALLKVLSHEVGPVLRVAEKLGAEGASHGASRIEKIVEKTATSPGTLEQFAKETAKTEATAARNSLAKAGAGLAAAGSALPLAAQDSTTELRGDSVGLEYESTVDGPRVSFVRTGSPAAGAGILPGDVVIEFNGIRLRGLTGSLLGSVFSGAGGRAVEVTVTRNGALVVVSLDLRDRR